MENHKAKNPGRFWDIERKKNKNEEKGKIIFGLTAVSSRNLDRKVRRVRALMKENLFLFSFGFPALLRDQERYGQSITKLKRYLSIQLYMHQSIVNV